MNRPLPTGVVTFLMTDVEASTRVWREAADAAALMARQLALIAAAVDAAGGVRPGDQGEGDSLLAAFASPGDALAAAFAAQRALCAETWPDGEALRVRIAVHSGEAELRDERNYGGLALIRCARLRSLAHGGQVLVSSATAALASERLPAGASLVELETVVLAGFERPERVHQLLHPELPGDFAALRRSAATLRPSSTPLVGRDHERLEVAKRFADGRLVTITGAGGAGKTRLAHAVAEDLAERFEDGVVWVELARLSSESQVAGAVAAACGVMEVAGASALEVVARHLARVELLLVLDNCEHLLGACAELADRALRAGERVRVLATSREPLGAPGEISWRIPSLALPGEGARDLESVCASDAVRLFVERARAARPDFTLDATSAPAVARICRRLDGIPLALELAAARVRALSVERLADGLDDRFRLLTGGARTAMARQRTLLASVEWSHALLDEDERALFRRLAVFASPFALDAAEAVAADDELDRFEIFGLLARLIDKSLVQHTGDRYQMLETLRHYALERAVEAGELAALRDRHLTWFRRRAQSWRLDREIGEASVLAEVALEAADLYAALDWSIDSQRGPAVELLYALCAHWQNVQAFQEARGIGAKLLASLEEGSEAWLEALAPLSELLLIAGETAWIPAARRKLDEPAASDSAAHTLVNLTLSTLMALMGQPAGIAGLERAAAIGTALGNRRLEIRGLSFAAIAHAAAGNPARARTLLPWLERQVYSDTAMGFQIDTARALIATYDGNLEAARKILAPHVDRGKSGPGLGLAGSIGLWSDDEVYLRRVLAISERNPAIGVIASIDAEIRTGLAALRGEHTLAIETVDRALATGFTFDSRSLVLILARADARLALGDLAGAEADAADVERRLESADNPFAAGMLGVTKAHLARRRGAANAAETNVHEALALAAENDLPLVATRGLDALVLLHADGERPVDAARVLGAVDAYRTRAQFRYRPHHYRDEIVALRERLDPALLDEGASQSLWEAVAHAQRGRGERGRPDHGWESLTPTEIRVVELVAAGLPNKEVARRLFVSVATVKTHLVHVFGKLDVRTRAELAAIATRRRVAQET